MGDLSNVGLYKYVCNFSARFVERMRGRTVLGYCSECWSIFHQREDSIASRGGALSHMTND